MKLFSASKGTCAQKLCFRAIFVSENFSCAKGASGCNILLKPQIFRFYSGHLAELEPQSLSALFTVYTSKVCILFYIFQKMCCTACWGKKVKEKHEDTSACVFWARFIILWMLSQILQTNKLCSLICPWSIRLQSSNSGRMQEGYLPWASLYRKVPEAGTQVVGENCWPKQSVLLDSTCCAKFVATLCSI